MPEEISAKAGIVGFVVGMVLAGSSYFGAMKLAGAGAMTAAVVLGIAAVIGAGYSTFAFARTTYAVGFLSILGFVLDMSWSLINTVAGFLVWIPACRIAGAKFITPTDDTRRSGTFAYDKNPRGGGYTATTIGTVIAGGWSSHEEMHVWQARIFGPTYLISYAVALVLNIPFRLLTGKTEKLTMEAYYRVPFEDWAYWSGSLSGNSIEWGWWFLGLFLALIYTGSLILIVVGLAVGNLALWLTGLGIIVVYSVIRAFAPRSH